LIMNSETEKPKAKLSAREFFSMGEVGQYFFRGKDAAKPVNVNVKIMHGINKFSIVIFLAAVIYMLLKHFVF
jgi:hypothetical protein